MSDSDTRQSAVSSDDKESLLLTPMVYTKEMVVPLVLIIDYHATYIHCKFDWQEVVGDTSYLPWQAVPSQAFNCFSCIRSYFYSMWR